MCSNVTIDDNMNIIANTFMFDDGLHYLDFIWNLKNVCVHIFRMYLHTFQCFRAQTATQSVFTCDWTDFTVFDEPEQPDAGPLNGHTCTWGSAIKNYLMQYSLIHNKLCISSVSHILLYKQME